MNGYACLTLLIVLLLIIIFIILVFILIFLSNLKPHTPTSQSHNGKGPFTMAENLIPATVIGSWSFPGWYEKFIADVKAHPERFGPADRDEAVRDAVRLAIDDQLRAGLDRITDGEMQRVDFNLGFYEYLRGLEPISAGPALGSAGARSARPLSCVEPLVGARRAGDRRRVPPAPRIHRRAGQGAGARARSPWPAASTAARSTPTATP